MKECSEYVVHTLGDAPLPHQQHIVMPSEAYRMERIAFLDKVISEIDAWITKNAVSCPVERRGDTIAALAISGQWKDSSCLTKKSADAEASSKKTLEEHASTVKGKSIWKQIAKAALAKFALLNFGGALKTYLIQEPYRKSLGPLASHTVLFCAPVKATSGFRHVKHVSPGYGGTADDAALRVLPQPLSFMEWLAKDSMERCGEDALFFFDGYVGVEDDIRHLCGLMRAGQSIFVRQAVLSPLLSDWQSQKHNDGILYTSPPLAWLKKRLWEVESPSWPLVTVVLPSFNQASFVRQALDSVFSQGYPKLETIVLDPGSTDGTRDILLEYKDRITHLLLEPDKGQSDALQRGLNMANGDIITWLCTDDLFEPDAFFRMAEAFMVHGVDVVVGGCRRIDETGRELYRHYSAMPFGRTVPLDALGMFDLLNVWQAGHFYYQPEVFFTKEIWQRTGAFFHQSAYYGMDYDLWIRMALAGARGIQILHPLAASRIQEGQKTRVDTQPEYLYQCRNFLQHYRAIFDSIGVHTPDAAR